MPVAIGGPVIADRRQPGVDDVDVVRRDRDQAGLIEPALLDVREVERPVADDGPPRLPPYCFWLIGSLVPDSALRRVEAVVAEVAVEVAVQRVRAALGHDVDVAAERAAELGLPARGDHLKLLDGVDAVGNAAQPRRIVVGRQAVDDEVVREVALAADRDALTRAPPTSRRTAACCRCWSATRRAPAAPGRGSCGRSAAGCSTSVCETVPAIWLRAASSTVASADDGDARVEPGDRERDRQLERRADRERHVARRRRRIPRAARRSRSGRPADRETGSVLPDR